MTEDDIIEMAHQAGITYVTGHGVASATFEWLDAFASLVAAREREACAKVCDVKASDIVSNASDEYREGRSMAATVCAAAIRARSEK